MTTPPSDDERALGRRWARVALYSVFFGLGSMGVVLLRGGWADLYRRLPSAASPAEWERVQAENRDLAMEIELASGEEPYLVVDLSVPSLTLKARGVPLRSFHVLEASGESRRFLGLLGGERQLPERTWNEGSLLPHRKLERKVILATSALPPDKAGEVDFIPPTPEEENPALPSFRIKFQGGLSAFILAGDRAASDAEAGHLASAELGNGGGGDGGGSSGSVPRRSSLRRLLDRIQTHPWQRDPLRIELVLPPADAGAFYRAFTDGTALLVKGLHP